MSWVWYARADHEPAGCTAWAACTELDGGPAGGLATWPAGPRPVEVAWRGDGAALDPHGPAGRLSLVLPTARPTFDDIAVVHAIHAVLRAPWPRAVTTLTSDPVHFDGAITVYDVATDPPADDPFARIAPARVLRCGPGLFGTRPRPGGPASQRYAGAPWPVAGFG